MKWRGVADSSLTKDHRLNVAERDLPATQQRAVVELEDGRNIVGDVAIARHLERLDAFARVREKYLERCFLTVLRSSFAVDAVYPIELAIATAVARKGDFRVQVEPPFRC